MGSTMLFLAQEYLGSRVGSGGGSARRFRLLTDLLDDDGEGEGEVFEDFDFDLGRAPPLLYPHREDIEHRSPARSLQIE